MLLTARKAGRYRRIDRRRFAGRSHGVKDAHPNDLVALEISKALRQKRMPAVRPLARMTE